MTEPAPRRRPVPMPAHVVAALRAAAGPSGADSEAELVERLREALAALPADQRTAVVAAHGYGEGPVGAAVELDCEVPDADALAGEGLAALRQALRPPGRAQE